MRALVWTLVVSVWLLAPLGVTAADVPYLSGRVNDEAEILSEGVRRALSERLRAHEERTGNQIAVLTIPSIGAESIEDYAVRVFEAWKLGQAGKDNGVLVVVAPQDRRLRIEVGYGLEATLTDLLAGRIIRTLMTPRFKAGDYDGGVEAGVNAIVQVLEQGAPAELLAEGGAEEGVSSGSGLDVPDMPIALRILIGAFIFGIIGLFTVLGVLTPGMGWFLYFFLIPFWAMFPIVVLGTTGTLVVLILYLVGYPIAKLMVRDKPWYRKAQVDLRQKGRARIGGFTVSSGGSGGGWSSGGSSGGFSGGGGSSGGGGASGSW